MLFSYSLFTHNAIHAPAVQHCVTDMTLHAIDDAKIWSEGSKDHGMRREREGGTRMRLELWE